MVKLSILFVLLLKNAYSDNLGPQQERGKPEDQAGNQGKTSIFDLFTRKTSSASQKSLTNDVEYMNLSAVRDDEETDNLQLRDALFGPVGNLKVISMESWKSRA